MRCENAVRGVGTEHIEVTLPKAALALVEHIERFRLVLFHRGHCPLEHGLSLLCLAGLTCRVCCDSEQTQHGGVTDHERETPQHNFLHKALQEEYCWVNLVVKHACPRFR